jgi:hypothetical protein
MAAASVWFRVEATSDIVDLRDAIYANLKAELEPRGITARLLVLKTAAGEVYDDEEAKAPTDRYVRARGAAAAYGPRSSCGSGRAAREEAED